MSKTDERPADRAPDEARQRRIREATLLSLVVVGVVYGVERHALAAILVAVAVWLSVYFVSGRRSV